MSKNRFELHEERLSTTDAQGHRVYVHPEDVKGVWRNRRTIVYWFLIILYMVLPWFKWNGKQVIQLDIVHREFTFFGNVFYAHDAPLILLLLLGFLFTMGFITSLYGRAWCGWACPQTVFIDAVYRKIELFIEGKARARQALDQSPWNFTKIWKRALKWLLFLLVSMHIAHSFIGYFVGTRELFWITMSPPGEHWTLFVVMWVITGIFLFDFGWFREQFCLIACPYGRIQSVMMDQDSYNVAYDAKRGEPHRQKDVSPEEEGDCINCYHCVKVCPTGIDIRRGLQLECIACTQCIDACDEIMEKVGKPKGLIRYEAENVLNGKPRKKFKLRNGIYLTAMIAVLTVLIYAVTAVGGLKVTYVRGTGSSFRVAGEGLSRVVTNNYKVRLDYKGQKDLKLWFVPKNRELSKDLEIKVQKKPFPMVGGDSKTTVVFFRFKPDFLTQGNRKVKIDVLSGDSLEKATLVRETEVNLVGPLK